MRMEVFKQGVRAFRWRIMSKTNKRISVSDTIYGKRCHALETAEKIAGRRMKVVVVD